MYEQALQKKQTKTNGKERIVNLRKGAINDIRSRLFDRKNEADETPKIPVKPKTKKKVAPSVPARNATDKLEQVEDMTKDNADVDLEKTKNEEKTNVARKISNTKQTSENSNKTEMTQSSETTNKEDASKPKRQSVITDFAALEKTYRILGIHKEPAYVPEDTDATLKKRNVKSEGKQKKSKKKSVKKESAVSVKQEEISMPQISIVDRIQNENKKNFFQEMINQKKGLVKEEPVLLRAQKRKKTSIASAFEEKTTNEESKRNSIAKDELKVNQIHN